MTILEIIRKLENDGNLMYVNYRSKVIPSDESIIVSSLPSYKTTSIPLYNAPKKAYHYTKLKGPSNTDYYPTTQHPPALVSALPLSHSYIPPDPRPNYSSSTLPPPPQYSSVQPPLDAPLYYPSNSFYEPYQPDHGDLLDEIYDRPAVQHSPPELPHLRAFSDGKCIVNLQLLSKVDYQRNIFFCIP